MSWSQWASFASAYPRGYPVARRVMLNALRQWLTGSVSCVGSALTHRASTGISHVSGRAWTTPRPDLEENPMLKRTSGLVLAGILATGAVGAVAMTPASATTSDNAVTSRLANIKSALSGLVSDGTLTQSQADKVAGTLDSKLPKRGERGERGPGGRFGGMGKIQREAAAKALGLTPDKLQTALKGGKSLADVAKSQKVSVDFLVKAMFTAVEGELATAVKDGTLTQAKADKMKSSLPQRITNLSLIHI